MPPLPVAAPRKRRPDRSATAAVAHLAISFPGGRSGLRGPALGVAASGRGAWGVAKQPGCTLRRDYLPPASEFAPAPLNSWNVEAC